MLLTGPAAGQSLPPALAGAHPELFESGAGPFRILGFHICDARLWVSPQRLDPDSVFVLGLRYARRVRGATLAKRTLGEMERLGLASEQQIERWGPSLRSMFQDVSSGDEMHGLNLAGRGVAFFINGERVGAIPDPAFAQAFFGIWFDQRTRAQDLRPALLGLGESR